MNKGIVIGIVVLLIGGIGVWLFSGTDIEGKINVRLDELSAKGSKSAKEKQLTAMANGAEVAKFFTSDVKITVGKHTFQSRDQLKAISMRARSSLGNYSVDFEDRTIHVLNDKKVQVILTLVVDGDLGRYAKTLQAKECEFTLVHEDGEWLISNVKEVEVFRNTNQ